MTKTTPLPLLLSLFPPRIAPLHAIYRHAIEIDPLLLAIGGLVVLLAIALIFGLIVFLELIQRDKHKDE